MKLFVRLALIQLGYFCTFALAEPSPQFTVGLSVWVGYPRSVEGFKAGLAEAGIIENQHIRFIVGSSGGNGNKQKKIATSFKEAKVDLVYSLTTSGTVIIKKIMPDTTPIVFSIVTYPADSGLIESLEYSGNNLVGTSNFVPYEHYISLLKRILPETKSVAIFHRKNEPNSKIQAINIRRILTRQGIDVSIYSPTTLDEVKLMAQTAVGENVDVLMTTTDSLMQSGGESILIKASLANGIPILSSNKSGIESGATFGPVVDFYTLGKMSGKMAANILLNKVRPTLIRSQLQHPPLFLVNKSSLNKLKVKLPLDLNVVYVEASLQ